MVWLPLLYLSRMKLVNSATLCGVHLSTPKSSMTITRQPKHTARRLAHSSKFLLQRTNVVAEYHAHHLLSCNPSIKWNKAAAKQLLPVPTFPNMYRLQAPFMNSVAASCQVGSKLLKLNSFTLAGVSGETGEVFCEAGGSRRIEASRSNCSTFRSKCFAPIINLPVVIASVHPRCR